ncbi:MAG TPA: hypothetical protein VG013_16350 [Gemmataceae bacterium]|jgi:hypothetical protein|nr:hypothetical protein [Gemmataceae bacterium]
MVQNVWQAAANMVASHIRSHKYRFHRGLLLIPRDQEEVLIAWVFGNDDYRADDQVKHDVDRVRQRLREATVEELAFGLSGDGHTWVLVVQADNHCYQTRAAKAFHTEMVRALLDEAVEGAGPPPFIGTGDDAGAFLQNFQPASPNAESDQLA